jgi:hypothetical protein
MPEKQTENVALTVNSDMLDACHTRYQELHT